LNPGLLHWEGVVFLDTEPPVKTPGTSFLKFLFIFIFWPCHETYRILVLQSGINLTPPKVGGQSSNQWTIRENGRLNDTGTECLIDRPLKSIMNDKEKDSLGVHQTDAFF